MEGKKLSIPQGIKLKPEYYNGYGKAELIATIKVMIVAILFGVVLYFIIRNMFIVSIFMVLVFIITVAIVIKNQYNISFYNKIIFAVNFNKRQKKYLYKINNNRRFNDSISRKNKKRTEG